jgi:hypothetical protein
MSDVILPLPEPHPEGKEFTVWGWITPTLAAKYLERNINNFRPISEATVEKYVSELEKGYWVSNHQGIAFDLDRKLADGQHRLTAIVRAGVSIYMPVTFNLSPKSMRTMDQGRKRSNNEILNGIDKINRCGNSLSGILKCAILGVEGGNRTAVHINELSKAARLMFDGLKFLDETFTKKVPKVTTAPVLGCILRAWHSREVDRPRIAEFAEIMMKGRLDNRSGADINIVVDFREKLRTSNAANKAGGAVDDTFAKCERVLMKYLNRERPSQIIAATKEMFPLPWEKKEEFSEEEMVVPTRSLEEAKRLVEQMGE